ncbi:MAG: hypothetical protein ACJ8R9_35140 [Steroidobacteraceae bacterium]
MRRTTRGIMLVLSAIGLLSSPPGSAREPSSHVLADAVTGRIKPAKITVQPAPNAAPVTKTLPFFSSGPLMAAAAGLRLGAASAKEERATEDMTAQSPVTGQARNTIGCSQRASNGNVRVNQDCTYRRQAEEKIVYSPADPNNLVAGQNDSRVGFNQCGIDWSTDNGRHWGDLLPPFRQRLNDPASELATPEDPNSHTIVGGPGTGHTYDFASDPAPTFDSQGRAFFTCVGIDVATNANLLFATQSPVGAQGSFFYNLPSAGRNFIVDEENDPHALLDKPFTTADTFVQSPNRENVYATWTVFNFTCGATGSDFCSGTIYGSMSTDHGLTWSTPEEISGVSPLCFFGNQFDPTRSPNSCDFDQGSEPAAQPNGNLVVIFTNGNTPADNPNGQQLAVVCRPSGGSPEGSAKLNCNSPVKVGDDIVAGEPECDFGRGPEECIPGAFIRTNDFPRLTVNPVNGHLFAAWQDYRNQKFDIQLTSSSDGGRTWSASKTVNPASQLDHYFPAPAVSPSNSDRVGVSYYRTQRVPNENTTPQGGFAPGQPGVSQGNSDYVLAGGRGLRTPFNFKVVSPVFPPPDGNQAGFNGDYSGLTINREGEAHPIWSDTRNVNPFPLNGVVHDEDVFTGAFALPETP